MSESVEMFHKTGMYGYSQVWYRHGELPWWKWFAFHMTFRRVRSSVFVAMLFAVILLGLTALVTGGALSDGRLDFWLVLATCVAVALVICVLPTVVAKKIRTSIAEDSNYRFGDMLSGDSSRKGHAAPSFVVLREYERVTQPLDRQSAENRHIINEWLAATWDADYGVMKMHPWYDRSHDEKDRWKAITERIDSFMALPVASSPGVGRALDELAAGLYRSAYRECQQNLAVAEQALGVVMSHRDMMEVLLMEFGEHAPEGFVAPAVKKPVGSEVVSAGYRLFSSYRGETK